MGRFVVVDQDSFEPGVGMTLDQEDMVDRDGYRDTESIVREFVMAGERLSAFRREEFDAEYDDVEVELPPTRAADFDMASASMAMRDSKSIEELEEEIRVLREEEKKKSEAPVVEPVESDGAV